MSEPIPVAYRKVYGELDYLEAYAGDRLLGSVRLAPNGSWLAVSEPKGKKARETRHGFPDRKTAAAWLVARAGLTSS